MDVLVGGAGFGATSIAGALRYSSTSRLACPPRPHTLDQGRGQSRAGVIKVTAYF